MLNPAYTLKSVTLDDAERIAVLITTYNETLKMPEEMSAKALWQLWKQPYFDLGTDAWVVLDGQQVIAYAQVQGMPPYDFIFYWGCEHPNYFGQGLREYLLGVAQARCKKITQQAAPDKKLSLRTYITGADTQNIAVLEADGWHLESRYLILERSLDEDLEAPEFPSQFTLKSFDAQNPELVRMVFDAERAAFDDQDAFYSPPFDVWKARMLLGNFDANLWVLAMAGEELAGFTICQANRNRPHLGWIRVIGVHPQWRKQGLGLALLLQSFQRLKAAGMSDVGLQVHDINPTGAVNLYKRAGMTEIASKKYYEKLLVR